MIQETVLMEKPRVAGSPRQSDEIPNLSEVAILTPVWDAAGNWAAVLARVPGGSLRLVSDANALPWHVTESRWRDRGLPSVALPVGNARFDDQPAPVVLPWELSLHHVNTPVWRLGADNAERWRDMTTHGADAVCGLFWRSVHWTSSLHQYRMVLTRLLDLLSQDADENDIVEAVQRNPMVVMAVLRLANALRGRADSRLAGVREGVAAVGRKQLYRWVMLMLLASRDSVAGSLEPQMLMALHRARLMQEVCASAGPPLAELADEAFLVGTISLMQGVLKKSPAELVERVLAGDATRDCMLASRGPLARPLALVKALEEERFEAAGEIASGLGVAPGLLLNCQQATMHWLSEVKEQCYQ